MRGEGGGAKTCVMVKVHTRGMVGSGESEIGLADSVASVGTSASDKGATMNRPISRESPRCAVARICRTI